ncbi:efflux RND transporter periplasmic adaptor subunit [Rhizobium sp. SEMIA 4085]|uniref:RND family efflux transporter protein n=1 Tax=Rhizobium gallicum bv. gallicum R602sp TaxID=1041138 RepID=A0A0B4WVC4_9HYPH|nr:MULTISPECIES: efflux RND transporter periplasmic adaptor subunit [Rhizobium]AJD39454.1 RND family efflux transporter protein [Rhizobium gallicum bv. gallicum R602sp]NNH30884.1 efflux RND transporter periplasmic adaptor subunit [Rhizobium sp. SEMIA 4085]
MRTILVAALLAIGAVALSSCEKQATNEVRPKRVETVVVKTAPVGEINFITGEVSARVQSDLSFRVSGRIVARLVDVGAFVKAGQVLARIDAEEQKADLDVATANLQSARAQQTQAQLAFGRQQNLFKAQVTTRAALDQAQEALLTAQGSLKSAQAQLDTARDAFSYTELRADADGVITARNAEIGQIAQAAQRIFTLAHEGPRDAVFNVYESLYLGRKLEDKVTVGLLSTPSRKVDAAVREISPTIDPSTGTIRVKVGLEGAPYMSLGAPVVGSFRSITQDTIELPWSAMASKGGQPAVWVVDPSSSSVSIRPVDVSSYGTGRFAVRTGVSPGEIVVSDGTKFLRPNEVVSYDKEAAK